LDLPIQKSILQSQKNQTNLKIGLKTERSGLSFFTNSKSQIPRCFFLPIELKGIIPPLPAV
jgi:hypothetical protein